MMQPEPVPTLLAYVRDPEPDDFLRTRATYLLTASVDYDAGTITATERARVTNTSASPITLLNFSVLAHAFGEFAVTSGPTVNGREAAAHWTNSANIAVPLEPPLRPAETAIIEFGFIDRPTVNLDDDLDQRLSRARGIMVAADWYPILSNGHGVLPPGDSQFTASSTVVFDVTLNRPMALAAPGSALLSSGTHSIYELANARSFTFAVSPSYRRLTSPKGGVTVDVYYTPGNEAVAKAARASARLALSTFGEMFGAYPYDRLVIAQSPADRVGDEWSGMVTIGKVYMGRPMDVVHEVAHQWWYGVVGNDQMASPWLDEGFAEFLSHHVLGLPQEEFNSDLAVGCRVTCWDSWWKGRPGSYGQTIYYKSAAMLERLRTLMGDERFFGALADMQNTYRWGVLTTPAAVALFEKWALDRAAVDDVLRRYGAMP